jgi:hypothetical protein
VAGMAGEGPGVQRAPVVHLQSGLGGGKGQARGAGYRQKL